MPDPIAASAAPQAGGDPAAATTTTGAPAAGVVDPATSAPAAGAPTTAAAPATGAPATGTADPATSAPVGAKDWATLRTEYANGDEKLEKRLARYSSEKEVLDALIAAQNKISSGTLKSALPEKPTPEQLDEWRKDNGVPLKIEDYAVNLPQGVTIEDADRPYVDNLLKSAHEKNMTPSQVEAVAAWYFDTQEKQVAEIKQADAVMRQQHQATLKSEWGSEYDLNINMVSGLLDTAPQGLKDQILGSRLADGTELGSNPDALRFLASLARTVNPVATVVPGAGGNAAQAIESEMASIQKLMGDKKSAYWKGPESAKMQARYRDLVTVQGKLK